MRDRVHASLKQGNARDLGPLLAQSGPSAKRWLCPLMTQSGRLQLVFVPNADAAGVLQPSRDEQQHERDETLG